MHHNSALSVLNCFISDLKSVLGLHFRVSLYFPDRNRDMYTRSGTKNVIEHSKIQHCTVTQNGNPESYRDVSFSRGDPGPAL